MFNEGHELGRVTPGEINAAILDALVYREYLDPDYLQPKRTKLIAADANEPPWDRRVPGAVLYAKPGERLYIHLLNGDRDNCHSFHLHGLKYGIDADGAWPFGVRTRDGRRSDEILPGQRWTYVFDVTPEMVGAWAFHDHVRQVGANLNRGLFGGLIVRDPQAAGAEHEIPLFVHSMQGASDSCQFESDSLGFNDTFSFTFGTAPDTCHYICKIHGSMMSGSVQIVAGGPAKAKVTINKLAFLPAMVKVAPGGTVTWKNIDRSVGNTVNHIVYASGGGAQTYCLNGRAYVGNTPTIEVESGARLRWYLFNLDLGDVWHNFHPHSSRWQLPAPPGGAADVHKLSPAESFVADTVAPPALRLPCALEDLQCEPPASACRVRLKGNFLFHCHIEEHMMRGLAGLLRARQYVWVTEEVLKRIDVELPYDDGSNDCGHVDLQRCPPHRDETGGHANPAGGVTMSMPSGFDMHEAAAKGVWELLPCNSQVLAVHAALLRTGKILFFAGSGNDPDKLAAHDMRSVVWDYERGGFHRPTTPIDVFCAGHAFLPDGKLLVAGGTEKYAKKKDDPFFGLKSSWLFDPILEEWIRVGDMAGGRWYPSLVTRGDGSVIAVSGTSSTGDNNRVPEVYRSSLNWSARPASTFDWPLFPQLFLLRSGNLFYSGGNMGGGVLSPGIVGLPSNKFTKVAPPAGFDLAHRNQAFSVLLPPAQDHRVMIMGGGMPGIDKVYIADLSGVPAWKAAKRLHHARAHALGVVLPDRTVLVTGGSVMSEDVTTATLESEIYNPTTKTWTLAAKSTVPRVYHGVALLLPDARVITAGSNPNQKDDELRLELYHPPYLFRGPRPFIEQAPSAVYYGDTITLESPQANDIKWVELVHPGATTHSSDTSQRLVDMPFKREGFCRIKAHVPKEPNLAPPGWYMLFVTNRQGVPSIAKWVHLARQ
jgi:plastocyanin